MKRYREVSSMGEIWRVIGDRSGGGRDGMNNPKKGRRNCGSEGLDKSVIVKKAAESRV